MGEEYSEVAPEFVNDAGLLLKLAEEKAQELNKAIKPEKPFTREEILRTFTAGGVDVSAKAGIGGHDLAVFD